MTDRSVTHATFSLERTYDRPPAETFAAWADPATKAAGSRGQAAPSTSWTSASGAERSPRPGAMAAPR